MRDARIHLTPDDLILSDFDGTISRVDTGLAMIEALGPGREEAWELEYRWRRGEIDSMACLSAQWGLLRRTAAEVYEFLDGLHLDEVFFDLLALVRERRAGIAILSDGLGFYVEHLLGRHGVLVCTDESCLRSSDCLVCLANTAVVTDGGMTFEFPYRTECGQCGNCKAADLFRLREGFRRTIYIGDGHSDLCAARYADVIFAKEALAEDCLKAGRPFRPFEGFGEVLAALC